jgi:SAM-dependent methyltransferase
MKGYQPDLSYIHDVGFTRFAVRSAPAILRLLKKTRKHAAVVELGCGSGVLARRMTDAGYQVFGIDVSPAMIEIARKKAPRARLQSGSFWSVPLPSCDAVIAIGEVFNYEFDRKNRPRELYRLFRRVHEALSPGGIFIFDLAGPGRATRDKPSRSFKTGDDWAVLVESEETRSKLKRKITAFRRVGPHYRRSEEMHVLRLYPPSEIAAQLRQIGFRVRLLRGYGATRFDRGLCGFVASKRS